MVKELYDPYMFNYMWESLDQDRFVVGTYYIEDTMEDVDFIDHLGQVQRLALEGSTASWMEVKEETPEVRERLSSKVLGYYEIPTPLHPPQSWGGKRGGKVGGERGGAERERLLCNWPSLSQPGT